MNHLIKKELNDVLKPVLHLKIKDVEKIPSSSLTVVIGFVLKVYSQWPKYADYESRLASFNEWMGGSDASQSLSSTGLFCLDSRVGETVCIACNVGFCEWEANDDPEVEHRQHSPFCPFILVKDILQRISCQGLCNQESNSDVSECARRLDSVLNDLCHYLAFANQELSSLPEVVHSEDIIILAAYRYLMKPGIAHLPSNLDEILRSILHFEEDVLGDVRPPHAASILKFWHNRSTQTSNITKHVPFRRQRCSVSSLSRSGETQ